MHEEATGQLLSFYYVGPGINSNTFAYQVTSLYHKSLFKKKKKGMSKEMATGKSAV